MYLLLCKEHIGLQVQQVSRILNWATLVSSKMEGRPLSRSHTKSIGVPAAKESEYRL